MCVAKKGKKFITQLEPVSETYVNKALTRQPILFMWGPNMLFLFFLFQVFLRTQTGFTVLSTWYCSAFCVLTELRTLTLSLHLKMKETLNNGERP